MQVVENVALISINATLLVQLISFLLFMMLFNRILIKPVRRVMAEREQYLAQVRENIKDINHSFEELSQQISDQEAEARRSAFKIREETAAAGQRSINELMTRTKQEIVELRLSAQKETDAQIARAREKVASEAEGLADLMIAALLGRKGQS
jgi:F-type H+-transporting ATPase subunit b